MFFFWPGMCEHITTLLTECDVCQQNKSEHVAYPGLLQPLPTPTQVWSNVSMDFIEGLPNSHGKFAIMFIVDRLSKYAHFIALSHPFSARDTAKLYFDHVLKLHGQPKDSARQGVHQLVLERTV